MSWPWKRPVPCRLCLAPGCTAALPRWGQGVVVTAYNSLGGARFATSDIDNAVARIARDRGMTVNAVLLAWARSKGCAVIPGSSTPAHIAENLAAPAFALSADEMRRIEDAPTPAGWWEGARGTTGPN